MKKLTKENFFDRCNKVHNNFYDYSLSNFIATNKKIKIICPDHGIFEQTGINHLNGQKCAYCANKKWSKEKFIEYANIIHQNRYDYSLITDYKNAHSKVKIVCKVHGVFEQIPWNHLNKEGCSYCAKNKTNIELIKKRGKLIHANKYDYSLIDNYKNNKSKIKIICPEHGVFEQICANHLKLAQGCPICNASKGEKFIKKFFNMNNISYMQYKKFDGCKYKNKLAFDFFVEKMNICVEYDGIQHYESVKWFGGDEKLKEIKIRDDIKTNFCKNNNITLIRIKYNDNLEEILNDIFL